MSQDTYRRILRSAVAEIHDRWIEGAPHGDSWKLGRNAGLLNALYSIEQAAKDAGIDPAEIGLANGWARPD